MTIPELQFISPRAAVDAVGQILVYGGDAIQPHAFAILVVEQQPALQKVFVIAVDSAADVAIGIDPLARLDIDPGANQANRRTALVNLDQGALGFVVENGPAGKLAERAEFNQQSSRLSRGWCAGRELCRSSSSHTCREGRWRIEDRQQAVAEIFRQRK
jgi:hypothetical protein